MAFQSHDDEIQLDPDLMADLSLSGETMDMDANGGLGAELDGANEHNDNDETLQFATPTRRKHSSSNASHHQSLAFELAAAMSPSSPTSDSLLEEIGIPDAGSGQDINDDQNDNKGHLKSPYEQTTKSSTIANAATSATIAEENAYLSTKSRNTSANYSSPTRRKISTSSSPKQQQQQQQTFDENQQEIDKANETLSQASTSLNNVVTDTQQFLQKIQNLVITTSNPSSSSNNNNSTITNNNNNDQQSELEQKAGDYARSMNDLAKARSDQNRELRELARQFSSIDNSVLSQLDNLEGNVGQEQQEQEQSDRVGSDIGVGKKVYLDSLIEENEESDMAVDQSSGVQKYSSTTSSTNQLSAAEQMAQLRTLTGQLISTLSTINEHAQLSRGITSEAERRLRSLKALVNGIRNDTESVDKSLSYIKSWQLRQSLESRGFHAKAVNDHKVHVQKLLDEFETRAKSLLQSDA